MATRERPADLGAENAQEIVAGARREIRAARRRHGLSLDAAARRAGMSASQLGRLERGRIARPTVDQVCRAARAVGLRPYLKLYPDEAPVRDAGQLGVASRFDRLLAPPLAMRREVTLPIAGDLRAWDARITDSAGSASIEFVARLEDVQDLTRKIERKLRDDPGAGVVVLVLARTAHNRRILAVHREALRARFPLDGAAIARSLRKGRVPPASGIIMV